MDPATEQGATPDEIREWLRVNVTEWRPDGEHGSHALHSPSGSHRWMVCEASIEAERGLPDSSSEFADEGTAAHEIASRCLEHEIDADDFANWGTSVARNGQVLIVDPDTASAEDLALIAAARPLRSFPVDAEMVQAVQRFVDAVRERGGDLFVEQRLDYSQYVPDGFGRGDAISINNGTLYVDDLKYGKGVMVDAAEYPGSDLYELGTHGNPQGMIYGLGALLGYDFMFEIDRVVIGIHQPRLDHITEFEIGADDLKLWAETQLVEAHRRTIPTDDHTPKFVPGEKQCKFCKRGPTCVARASFNIDTVLDGFDLVPPKSDDLLDLADHIPAEGETVISNEALAALLPLLDGVKAWTKAVQAHAQSLLENGETVPGYKLVPKQTKRGWIDEDTAGKAVQRKVKAKGAWVKKLISPAELEKVVGKNHYLLSDKYVEKKGGGPTIAPEHDKRDAIVVDVFGGFDDEAPYASLPTAGLAYPQNLDAPDTVNDLVEPAAFMRPTDPADNEFADFDL